MFDVIIIGAGVVGCAVARELAKYNLKIAVLEKEMDVCEATSMANSAIVHSGYDPNPQTLKAKLNVIGNKMFDSVCKELDVEFKRHGSITVAFNDEEIQTLKKLQENGLKNGVETKLLTAEELLKLEPRISPQAKGGLLAPTCGIVNPFELTVALMENAMDNGTKLFLDTQVLDIKKNDNKYVVVTDKGNYEGRIIINCAGLFSGKIAEMIGNKEIVIKPRKGQYYVLDHFKEPFVNHTLFPCPTNKGKGVLITPTTHGNYLIGPSSEFTQESYDVSTDAEDLAYVKERAKLLIPDVPFNYMIRTFAGNRAVSQTNDFIIEEDAKAKNFYHVAGIQSPGLASALAIAQYVANMINKNEKLVANKDFNPIRRPFIRLNKLSNKEKEDLIKKDSRFGKIVCRCEIVSEGEIIDSISRNCGARTIKGVKKRLRAGFGKCQGGFCEPLVIKILARELGVDPMSIRYGNKESYILLCKTKNDGGDK
ncbi:MAG: NAD(P)/FAD-dependent oxidoreductase [Bacilli bacterium]